MKQSLTHTAIATSLMLAFGNVHAADVTELSQAFTLGEINVSSTSDVKPSTGNTSVTREEIDDFNRENVQTALDLLPGVTKIDGGQRNESFVYVRGFDSRQVPLFIDGIPVYVSYDGNADLARFTTYDVASIEVAKGFSSVLYGPNTLGGAINIISRKPVKAFEGNVGVGIRSNDKFNSNGKSTHVNLGTNQGMWYAQFGLSYLDLEPYTLSRDFQPTSRQPSSERRNSYSTDKKVNVKFGLTPNATDEYAISYIKQEGEKGSPPYAGTLLTGNAANNQWVWPAWNKESIYFISNTAIGSDSYIKTRAYYDKFYNELLTSSITTPATDTSIYNDHTYGGSVELGTKLSARNTLKVAVHIKKDFHSEHRVLSRPVQKFEDQTTSISIEDTHRITDKLDLIVGASYDKRDGKKAQDYTVALGVFDTKLGNDSAFNPQAGLIYKTSATGNAYLTVAKKSRFPTIKDRYSTGMGISLANPDVKAEYSTNYQLGINENISPNTRVEAAVFYNDITDMLERATVASTACGGTTCQQLQNVSKVSSKGIELGINSFVTKTVEVGGNYTYIDRKNKSNALALINVPRNKVFAYTKWAATEKLKVIASVDHNSDIVSTTDRLRVASSFTLVNTKVSYALDSGVTIDAGINNLLDRNYAYTEGFYAAGRNLFANLNYRF